MAHQSNYFSTKVRCEEGLRMDSTRQYTESTPSVTWHERHSTRLWVLPLTVQSTFARWSSHDSVSSFTSADFASQGNPEISSLDEQHLDLTNFSSIAMTHFRHDLRCNEFHSVHCMKEKHTRRYFQPAIKSYHHYTYSLRVTLIFWSWSTLRSRGWPSFFPSSLELTLLFRSQYNLITN